MSMTKVGSIGGSGFVGSYSIQKFLQQGHKIKVSTTDLSNKGKYRHQLNLPNAENLELVQLNVENKQELTHSPQKDTFLNRLYILTKTSSTLTIKFTIRGNSHF